jgi:hypothetical protein
MRFVRSAVLRIRSSKSACANNLKLYRVDILTTVLTCLTNLGANRDFDSPLTTLPDLVVHPTNLQTNDIHSVWIPAPIIEHALPAMVIAYNQSQAAKKTGNPDVVCLSHEPVSEFLSQSHRAK